MYSSALMTSDPDIVRELSRIRRVLWLVFGAGLIAAGLNHVDVQESEYGEIIGSCCLALGSIIIVGRIAWEFTKKLDILLEDKAVSPDQSEQD